MRIKTSIIILLGGLLLFASFPLAVSSNDDGNNKDQNKQPDSGAYSAKDEVIYGNLAKDGTTEHLYVVNSFDVTEPGEIIDYGKYIDVRNLTDLTDLKQEKNDEVHFQADQEEFYYQGELENVPLPWDLSIIYKLDGEEINPNELAGKSGNLEIQITTTENEEVNPVFFDYYLLQISLTLDPLIFEDIQAPDGIEANEGKNKLITFSVMPEQEDTLIVSANVTNLKMDPIDITAMPANLAIDDPDVGNMTSDMKTLAEGIEEINAGVADLSEGLSDFSSGAKELQEGSSEYQEGINELDQSSGDLIDGSEQILNALQQVDDAMEESPDMPRFDELEELPEEFRTMAKDLRSLADLFNNLEEQIDLIADIEEQEINALYKTLEDNNADDSVIDTVAKLEQTYHAARAIKEINEKIPKQLAVLLNDMADHLDIIADGLEGATENIDLLDDLTELTEGLSALSSEYNEFHQGLLTYTDGVNDLANSYDELDEGIHELSEGASDLNEGANELHEGTEELHEETNDLPDQMQSEIDEFMEDFDYSDFDPTSFVSEQNDDIDVVQFVFQTEKIEEEEQEETENEEEEEKSMWQRFLDLFR